MFFHKRTDRKSKSVYVCFSVCICAQCSSTRSADLDIANQNTDAPVFPSCGQQKETQCAQEARADKGINPMTTNGAISGTSHNREIHIICWH